MLNEYIVKFNKGSNGYELHISAHNEEEAIKLAEMQSKYSNMGGGKFKFINVRMEGEEDTHLKDIYKYCSSAIIDKKE